MKLFGGVVGALLLVSVAQVAQAQDAAVDDGLATSGAPRARTGFQLGLRTGFALPMGKIAEAEGGSSEKLSDFTSGQVPLFVDIGAKVIPNLFIGGYVGFAFGGAGGDTADICDQQDLDCLSVGFRIGVEAIFSIIPDGAINPWVGYGIGLEGVGVSSSNDDIETSLTYAGYEFARFMLGADFRLNEKLGLGPFVEYSLGTYNSFAIKRDPGSDIDDDIDDTAMHQWLTLGARLVIFP